MSPTNSARDVKRLDIQGLRAVAVILVVAFHAGLPTPAGFAGVDMFFVISGYVITGQLSRLQNRFSFTDFYARRIRRLLPAMVVMLAVVLLLSFLLESPLGPQGDTATTALGAVFLAGNIAIWRTSGGYFDPSATSNPLLHVWSLGVEEQFYLFFPLVLVLAWRADKRRTADGRLVVATLAALTLASFLLALRLSGNDFAFYSSPTRAWEFGAGALLMLTLRRRVDLSDGRHLLPAALGLAGVVGLLGMRLLISTTTTWPGVATLVPVVATGLLIAAGNVGNSAVTRGLSWRPLAYVGDLSYSIYLWHWPVIVFTALLFPAPSLRPVAALASLVPAWLSYRYVERPFRMKPVPRARVFTLAAVATGVTATAAVTVTLLGPSLIAPAYQGQRQALTEGRTSGCLLNGVRYTPSDIERCTVRVADPKGWIMLVGDSHADALSTGVVAAAARERYDTVALTGAGCAFARTARSADLPNCGEMNGALLDRATGPNRPSLVIVSHSVAPHLATQPNWLATLRPSLLELRQARVPILYVIDVPNFVAPGSPLGSACRGGYLDFSCQRSSSDILSYQGVSRSAERQLAASVPGTTVFDPWPTFCRGGDCSSVLGGRLAYLDDAHLNAIGSRALEPRLDEVMHQVLTR